MRFTERVIDLIAAICLLALLTYAVAWWTNSAIEYGRKLERQQMEQKK